MARPRASSSWTPRDRSQRRQHSGAFDPTASARAPEHDPPRPRRGCTSPTHPRQGSGGPGNGRLCPDPPAHRHASGASPASRPRLNPQGRRPSCGFVQRSPMGTAAGLLRCSPPESRSAAPPIGSSSLSDAKNLAYPAYPHGGRSVSTGWRNHGSYFRSFTTNGAAKVKTLFDNLEVDSEHVLFVPQFCFEYRY
jgi:hypothetical protein